MRIAVTGSRSITDRDWIAYHLDKILDDVSIKHQDTATGEFEPIVLMSGGAHGVDTCVAEYAAAYSYDFILFKPYHLIDNHALYRPRFFFARNKQMVDNADVVIALWDGVSSGTKSTIELATHRHKELIVVRWNPDEAADISGK